MLTLCACSTSTQKYEPMITACPPKAEATEFIELASQVMENWNEYNGNSKRMYEIYDTDEVHYAIVFMNNERLSQLIKEMKECLSK